MHIAITDHCFDEADPGVAAFERFRAIVTVLLAAVLVFGISLSMKTGSRAVQAPEVHSAAKNSVIAPEATIGPVSVRWT
jgi:hypothetical protein